MEQSDETVNDTRTIYQPDYERICLIGKGTFGKVYKCQNTVTKDVFVVKEIVKSDLNLRSILAEIKILGTVPNHERLVIFYGVVNAIDNIKIFTEYMSQGSLRDQIDRDGPFNETKVRRYVKMIVEGIDFLHEHNVIHRDIKCANILLDDNDYLKLTDFGLSKVVEDAHLLCNETYCGTSHFMAPEIMLKEKYNSAVDIWALGVTIIEMLTGKPIYFDLKAGALLEKITSHAPVIFSLPAYSAELTYFLNLTFVKSSALRPLCVDLKRTKFLL